MALFSFKNSKPFSTFIESVKTGSENILGEVDLNENEFEVMPYSVILENPSDIAAGVNKVKLKTRVSVFDIFDSVLVKNYDNGETAYIFYTVTKDHSRITKFSETLFEKLGLGIYDSDRDLTFKTTENIVKLAKGNGGGRSIVNVWQTEKHSIVLQYRHQPLHQLSLIVTRKIERPVNTASRKGTINELLPIDINKIFSQDEISTETNLLDDGSLNCIDYKYHLTDKVLNAFDTITIRLFGPQKVFTTKTQTHLTFTISTDIPLQTKLDVCDKVIKIYDSDMNGYLDLDIGEVEMLENNEYWSGRRWSLNDTHGLHLPHDGGTEIYWVEITNSMLENGLTLTVGCYNKLLEYLTIQ